MKLFYPCLVALLFLSFNYDLNDEEIKVLIEFDINNKIENFKGDFSVMETNQEFTVNSQTSFEITLPKKGRYNFYFKAKGYISYINFPQRITEKNNRVVIKMVEHPDSSSVNYNLYNSLRNDLDYSYTQLDSLSATGNVKFIVHGITNATTSKMKQFAEAYNVGFIYENCVADPISFQRASSNNKIIHDYLNYKYGNAWKSGLPIKPIGFKL